MQIRTQHTLGTLVSSIALSIIALTLFNSIQQANEANARSNYATDVVAKGINELRFVAVEYIISKPERAKLQWQQKHTSLTKYLTQNIFDQQNEQLIMQELRLQHQYMQQTFKELVELDSQTAGNERERMLSDEVRKRLVTRLMIISQDSISDATHLAQITNARTIEAQRRTTWLIVLLLILIGLVILVNYVTALTQILGPINKLKLGTDAFAKGDFNFRTRLSVNNELGDLSRAFDQMAARLLESRKALEDKSALLQETNKELESFSYSVSHDLRSPLRGIDGWGLALIEDYGNTLDETAHEYVDRIRKETQHMGQLIDDLLQLARVTRSEIKREVVDLSGLANKLSEELKQTHNQRQIKFIIQPGMTMQGDIRLLEILMTNLLDNACKFTSPRPLACIEFGSTRVEDPESKLDISTYFVRDNGVGFDMAHAKRLFGAFQRMHRASSFPGTGIGLATVQRIVHRHGGKVWADAQLDQGATFYFTLSQTNIPLSVRPTSLDIETKESS
ncbi:HAMP domain-containing protein [Undibacterium sp. Jales W-56]|uniref:sensor histidine kinase n=1 Tax=Undibacterium sp. Jales W-56 TaxID=2897325 RepID=UPI0021D1952A|nr:ATP-binding protein [Undibacterium sp. Jales W-56]MCU6433362.1 HAMP domain-containing protein [Undibacterium sp. Jales W-56]